MAQEKEMFFFIADISGYTKYMLTNNTEEAHGKLSISLLIEALLKQARLPLKISKLEGDAIFLYLDKPVKDPLWLTQKIFTFFSLFEKKIKELKESNICSCGACQNIEALQLKVIAHWGKASFHKIGPFEELAGVDVIILHRLLKNHVESHRYFLLTESAYQHALIPDTVKVTKLSETYEDVGTIPIYVCSPPVVPPESLPNYNTFFYKLKRWLILHLSKARPGPYRHLP